MNKDNNTFEQEQDSLKDVVDFQNNMFNPGHYIGTGKVPPTVSAPGNALPLAIMCFFATALFLMFGLFLFFSVLTWRYSYFFFKVSGKLIIIVVTTAFRYLHKRQIVV